MLYGLISPSVHGKRTLSQTSQGVLIRKNVLRLTIATHPLCLKILLTKTGSLGVSISCMLITESRTEIFAPSILHFWHSCWILSNQKTIHICNSYFYILGPNGFFTIDLLFSK